MQNVFDALLLAAAFITAIAQAAITHHITSMSILTATVANSTFTQALLFALVVLRPANLLSKHRD
jgi:F0F1-type ATP synthase membrane subunit c/vacuolar-type H+-ATPase subunit K